MPGYVNGIPHATSTDRIDLWPTTSRDLAQWVDANVPRNDDPRLSNARPPTTHTHPISGVTGLQDALNGKTNTTDPRLSDARPPTTHTHDLGDVTGLAARLAALEQPAPTELGVTHLDTVLVSGIYVCRTSANAQKALGYPYEKVPGTLHVLPWNPAISRMIAVFYPWSERPVAKRTSNSDGTWRAWCDFLGNPIT